MSSMFENISDTEIAELKEIIRDIITTEYDYISADKGKRDQNQGMGEDIVFQLRGDEIKTLLDDRRYILSDKETEDVISLFCDLWEKSVCEVADNVIWRRRRGSRLRQPE